MDKEKVIADLRDQLEMVNQVIKIVEHLAATRGRGRPPNSRQHCMRDVASLHPAEWPLANLSVGTDSAYFW